MQTGALEDDSCVRSLVCPLSRIKAGTFVCIKELASNPDLQLRLRELGFCERQRIKLLSRHPTLICQICNARLGISRRLAETILVEALPTQLEAA
jgi:Fe2+ transport system protein FeoA